MNIKEFPILEGVNKLRTDCYQASFDPKDKSSRMVGYWLGHKVASMIALPLDLVGASVGMGLAAGCACTIGAAKVFIFAVTLGNIKPSFPSGFNYFGERSFAAMVQSFQIVGENLYDAGHLTYKGLEGAYRLTVKCLKGVKWVLDRLHLTDLVIRILKTLGEQLAKALNYVGKHLVQVLDFVGKRLEKGIEKAHNDNKGIDYKGISGLTKLENRTKAYRIDFSKQDRSFKEIGAHFALSVPNIALHAMAFACAFVALPVLSAAFIGKVLITAVTDLPIPVPTPAGYAMDAALETSYIVAKDVATDLADVAVTVYKTSELIGLNKVIATARDVLMYIPEAIFN